MLTLSASKKARKKSAAPIGKIEKPVRVFETSLRDDYNARLSGCTKTVSLESPADSERRCSSCTNETWEKKTYFSGTGYLWLPGSHFKSSSSSLTKLFHGQAPSYLKELTVLYNPHRALSPRVQAYLRSV